MTSDEVRLDGPVPDTLYEHDRGAAFTRTMPGGLVRQSIIVHRRIAVPGQYRQITALCSDESRWLDHALSELGVSGGLESLLSAPLQPQSRAADRRHPSGRYLPHG
jgi:hypothetical protein